MNSLLFPLLACPYDQADLKYFEKKEKYFQCFKCGRRYDFIGDVPNFLPDDIRSLTKDNKPPEKFGKKWLPGYRGWRPNLMAKLVSFSFRSDNGRVKEKLPRNREKLSVLDVGCGDDFNGDVNIDVYLPQPLPPNFLLASGEKLPFKNDVFNIVRSAYVVEHCLEPIEFIKEQIRVSQKIVKIYTDNSDWLGIIAYRILNTGSIFHDEHYYKWSKEYFENILNRLNLKGKVTIFNSSPALLIRLLALLGKLPRVGPFFYRDLGVEIKKKT
ncbi:MAG: hypothetical protein ABIB61_02370 [Candidatus Shapirobacteria bacterium]